jgi:hypothetical protein
VDVVFLDRRFDGSQLVSHGFLQFPKFMPPAAWSRLVIRRRWI